MFVTTDLHNGSLGGLDGADLECQEAANKAGLSGTFRAWLSDSTGSPSTRFTQGNAPYELVDGTTIATGWSDLTDGTIAAPINLDEFGNPNAGNFICQGGEVWTNTAADGTADSLTDCGDWLGTASTSTAGNVGFSNSQWTDSPCESIGCISPLPLYCFEQ